MLIHIASDGKGGFFLFEDPVGDLMSGMGLNAFLMGMIVLLIFPITINPAEFAAPLLCTLLGIFLIMLCAGMGVFHFLSSFALPLMVFGAAGYSAAVFHNAPNSPVSLLLFLIVPFATWLLMIAVLMAFFGGNEFFAILASIPATAIIFFSTVLFSPNKPYTPPEALFYMIRVTWVAAALKAGGTVIYDLIRAGRKKARLDFVSPVVNLPLILAGFLPLLAMKQIPGLAGFAVGSAAYVGTAIVYRWIRGGKGGGFQPSLLMLPLLWVFLGYLATMSTLLFYSEGIPEIISGIRIFGGAYCAELYWQVTETAGVFFASVLRMGINLVLMIFDTSIPVFHLPNLLSYVLILILEWLLILSLPNKILRKKA